MTDKDALRRIIRAKKSAMPAADMRLLSRRITDRLLALPVIRSARTLMLYHSLPDEVSTLDAIETLAADGKTVLLPHVINKSDMEMRVYSGSKNLREGSFGIMEPQGKPFVCYDEICVIVVPGMAFDKAGNRLGRGKGYYDRLLRRIPQAYKIGLCFAFQIVGHINTEEHDVPMDCLLSENGCINCRNNIIKYDK